MSKLRHLSMYESYYISGEPGNYKLGIRYFGSIGGPADYGHVRYLTDFEAYQLNLDEGVSHLLGYTINKPRVRVKARKGNSCQNYK